MHKKFLLLITALQINLSIYSMAFAQNASKPDTTNQNVKPKAVMPTNIYNNNKIEPKTNQDKKKGEKQSEAKSSENLVQEIIDLNNADLSKYEKLSFEEEHLSFFLNDSISFEIQKFKQLIQTRGEELSNALNKYSENYNDTSKRNKLRPLIIDELRTLYKEEIAAKDSLENSNFQEKTKQKELVDKRKQLKDVQVKLKPQIDSLNKIIASVKETTVLRIKYNSAIYRVLVVPFSVSEIKIHANNKKQLQPLKSIWDTFKDKPYALLNAGMYEADGSAKGLLVINGKIMKNLDDVKKGFGNFYIQPNGVYYLDTMGRSFIVKSDDYKKLYSSKQSNSVLFATQSGPMLLIEGKSNPNFQITSTNKNIRNGVGIVENSANKIALFIMSDSPCTFYDIASLFRIFRCSNALYLDGAISKMYTDIKGIKTGSVSEGQLGPILSVSKKR
jgi:uncharacterized protein YigE (DUF2233 family)